MGLWEFLRQWRGSRAVLGISASLLIHVLVVAAVLWGAKLPLTPQWRAKPGDALIVELPTPEEGKASPGTPEAPAGPVTPSAPPIAVKSPPSPPPAPPAQREAPPAPRRVASAPRAPEPARPAPRVAEPPRAAEPPQAIPRPPEQPADSGVEKAPSAETPASASTPLNAPATPKVERVPEGPRTEPGNTQVAGLPPGAPSAPPVPDTRSALRRGGGGRGEGRGGILGDPIPLDTPDPRFSDFMAQVKRQIEAKLNYPCIKNAATRSCEPKDTEVIVHFGILKNGRLQYVDLWVASPWPDYDVTSMTAIKLAQPFPPVPAAIMASLPQGSTGMPITGRFSYRVTYSTLVR